MNELEREKLRMRLIQDELVNLSIDDLVSIRASVAQIKLILNAGATMLRSLAAMGTGPMIELNPNYTPEEVNAFFDGVSQADKGLKIHDDNELYESERE